jgi:bleomycin hydrolase
MMRGFCFAGFLLLEVSLFAAINNNSGSEKELISSSGLNIIKDIPATAVKDQKESSTCWSFSGVSLIESELIRQGRGNYDLSEKYIIRCNYLRKAERYVRMHGKSNFSAGGEANDVTQVIDQYGVQLEANYLDINKDRSSDFTNMIELDKTLKTFVDSLVTNSKDYIDPSWQKTFNRFLDKYLGPVPEYFLYNGIQYTPKSFAEYLGLTDSKYTVLTSFIHHPYYNSFVLEVPDNWSGEKVYNMPLNELVEALDSALINGYTASWAVDITEDGFNFEDGVAYVSNMIFAPAQNNSTKKSSGGTIRVSNNTEFDFHNKVSEPFINDSIRQAAFNNYSTTDDHLMQIVGFAFNKFGQKYYYVKNSWGTDNPFNGYLFVSEQYFRFKTISIMLNKKAISARLLAKLGISYL